MPEQTLTESVRVELSPEVYLMQLKKMRDDMNRQAKNIKDLERQLEEERKRQLEVPQVNPAKKKTRKRDVSPETNTYSEFKSDGKRKARAAEPIRSYDDYKAIENYFLSKGRIRDATLWTVGVALGLRISDLLSLHFYNILNADGTFRPRIMIYEQKTGKANNCLITEVVRQAMSKYIATLPGKLDMNKFVFFSQKTGGKMYEECGWRIISEAGKALEMPFNVGSHTMRKSFANIAACVDLSVVDMNAITKIQGLLNHSDQRVTMKYLGTFNDMFDKARMAVSDFLLGKTDINELVVGERYTVDDVMSRLDSITNILSTAS